MAYESGVPPINDSSERRSRPNSNGVGYIEQIIKAQRESLRLVYATGDLSADTERRVLIERFGTALSMLDVEATMPGVLRHVRSQEEPGRHEPLVQLGYATLETDEAGAHDGVVSYEVLPTQEGIDAINGLRASIGEPTIEETRAANAAAMWRQSGAIRSSRPTAL